MRYAWLFLPVLACVGRRTVVPPPLKADQPYELDESLLVAWGGEAPLAECRARIARNEVVSCTLWVAECANVIVWNQGPPVVTFDDRCSTHDIWLLHPNLPDGRVPWIPSAQAPATCDTPRELEADCCWRGQGRDERGECVGVPTCPGGEPPSGTWCEFSDTPLNELVAALDPGVRACGSAVDGRHPVRVATRSKPEGYEIRVGYAGPDAERVRACVRDVVQSAGLTSEFVAPFWLGEP